MPCTAGCIQRWASSLGLLPHQEERFLMCSCERKAPLSTADDILRLAAVLGCCPTAVHMEAFSTSDFNVLICTSATTTKICTRCHSSPAHAATFAMTSTPSYSWPLRTCGSGSRVVHGQLHQEGTPMHS